MSGNSSEGEASSSSASGGVRNVEAAHLPEAVPGAVPLRLTMAGSGASSGPYITEAEGNAVGGGYTEDLGSDFRVPFSPQCVDFDALVREFNLPDQFTYAKGR